MDWQPSAIDINMMTQAYPKIDIQAEIRKMDMWCYTNPGKRKTKTGILRFINSWLSRSTPAPVSTRTRDRTIEQDLNDRSWAL
jgi:hypothetical protein